MFSPARRAQLGLLAVGAVFVTCMAVLGVRSAEPQPKTIPAPNFTLCDIDGRIVTLSDLRGSVVVLVFNSAQESAAYEQRIADLAQRHAAGGNVRILLIEDGVRGLDAARLQYYRQMAAAGCLTLVDRSSQVSQRYDITGTPTVVVIDPAGRIKYRGAFDDNTKAELVRRHYCEDAVASLDRPSPAESTYTQGFGAR